MHYSPWQMFYRLVFDMIFRPEVERQLCNERIIQNEESGRGEKHCMRILSSLGSDTGTIFNAQHCKTGFLVQTIKHGVVWDVFGPEQCFRECRCLTEGKRNGGLQKATAARIRGYG